MKPIEKKVTKTIDKFHGALTRENINDMNSGLAKFETTFGNNPFQNPSNLTWFEQPTSIITLDVSDGPIVMMRSNIETQNEFVYGVTAVSSKLYKIQVNDSASKVANKDTPSVISTFNDNGQSYRLGGDIQFYGASSVVGAGNSVSKLYVGGDNGVSKAYSDGSSPALVGNLNSYVSNVPRPMVQFIGKLYFGNGNNIGEIDSTETVTTYTKLSPGLPVGLVIRDLDVTPDGNYMLITASRLNQATLSATTIDVTGQSSVDSYKFLWNGSDLAVTSYETHNGYSLTASTSFGSKNYTMGFDLGGAALYDGSSKEFTMPNTLTPNFSAMSPIGNLLGFATTAYDTTASHLKGEVFMYGKYDNEVPLGLYRTLRFSSGQGTDVIFIPCCIPVSNLYYVPPFYSYTNNIAGSAKVYFSSTETKTNGGGGITPYYPLYKFTTVPTGAGSVLGGVYETQNEIYSKKFKATEIRFYTEPLVSGVSFQIDLIGSDGGVLSGSSKVFTVGTNVTAGQDYIWYNPATAPVHNLGVRITNLGTVNWVGIKLELDMVEQGK